MSAPNPSTAMARVLVDEWVRCGVTDVVVAPGSRSTALVFAVADREDLRLHVQIDERSAGFLAVGIGRATGRPAVVVTTSGTATANLHPAVAEADRSGVPLLAVTADRPPELRDTDANQTMRQVGLYGAAVRWQADLGVAEDRADAVAYWRSTAARSVAEAAGMGRAPGPVHLNAPFREPTVPLDDDGRSAASPFSHPLDGRADGAAWVDVLVAPRLVDPARIERVAGRMAGRRGIIIAGEGAGEADAVHALGGALGWPVLATALSGVRDRAGVVSTYHHLLASRPWAAEHAPEVVLRLGRVGPSKQVMRLLAHEVQQFAVLPDARWSDPERSTTDLLVGDPSEVCRRLAAATAEPAPDGWRESWEGADGRARRAINDVFAGSDALSEPQVAFATAIAVPRPSSLVVASSMPVRDLDAFMPPRPDLAVYGNRGVSGIDGFVSTTLGVALAHDGPTTALAGDLSLLHDGNGFLLDAGADVGDVTFVVLNNDGGGIFHFLPQARYPDRLERLFATPHGRDLATLAAFHGVEHHLVDAADELEQLVAGPSGIRIVEVRTDRTENVTLHEQLQAAVDGALA